MSHGVRHGLSTNVENRMTCDVEHRTNTKKEMMQMKTHEDLQQILVASEQLLDGVHEIIELVVVALHAVKEEVSADGNE